VSALLACATVPSVFSQEPILHWVEADDGVLLATDVYLPEGNGPWPAILIRTPYGRDRSDMVSDCTSFRDRGYACIIQDLRGLGESEGEFHIDQTTRQDGRATVAWISEQPWCDGKIGSSGFSAMALALYQLAPGAPEALQSLSASSSSPDPYHLWAFLGGALRGEKLVALATLPGLENLFDELVQHRVRDEWWDAAQLPIEHPELITAPGLHIGGWYDSCQGTLDGFSTFQSQGGDGARGRQALIIGPWTHKKIGGMTAASLVFPMNARLDVGAKEEAWHDYWLKGEDSGVEDWPTALVYLMGAAWSPIGIPQEPHVPGNVWLGLEGWPPPSRPLDLHLGGDECLSSTIPATDETWLFIDPSDPVPTVGGPNTACGGISGVFPAPKCGPQDQSEIEARDDVLVFSTDPLPAPLYVMGRISCTLWIRPDTTDLDLAVRLSDVYPSGHSMLVTNGIQRARMRCGDDHECFLVPGEPTEITVDLWSTALVFNKGHQVRISVSGSNWPRFEVNPNHGGDLNGDEPGIIARPDLLFGPEYPSRLTLPIWTPPPRQPSGRVGP
jgi:predicted acyl esterase